MTQEQHIDRLERQNRRLGRAGMVVSMAVLAALMVGVGLVAANCAGAQGTSQPSVVTGSEFRLVNAKGATRAVLALENDNPELRFLDGQGRIRISVRLSEQGSGLVFIGENGRPGASLGLSAHGPAIALGDGKGNVRAMLTVNEGGSPGLVLKDTTGHVVWTAP